MAKCHRLADQNDFHFAPAAFLHADQTHKSIKCLITGQIRHKLTLSKGEAKQSRVRSAMRWWTKRVSMVIALLSQKREVRRLRQNETR